jgi:hypothetical protein
MAAGESSPSVGARFEPGCPTGAVHRAYQRLVSGARTFASPPFRLVKRSGTPASSQGVTMRGSRSLILPSKG